MRKILFLDFDGVLNSTQSDLMFDRLVRNGTALEQFPLWHEDRFCPICLSNLLHVLETDPDIEIVISSAWRLGNDLSELQSILGKHGVPKEKIIDVTPNLPGRAIRQDNIKAWLSWNDDVEKWVAVDDMGEMEFPDMMDNLVNTSFVTGLTFFDALDVLEILG